MDLGLLRRFRVRNSYVGQTREAYETLNGKKRTQLFLDNFFLEHRHHIGVPLILQMFTTVRTKPPNVFSSGSESGDGTDFTSWKMNETAVTWV